MPLARTRRSADPGLVIAATATSLVRASRSGRLGSRLGLAATVLAVLVASTMLIPLVLGYQRYVITSGSMTGTYDRGSLVYDEVVQTSSLKVGDVITYTPPKDVTHTGRLTHRIFSITRGSNGVLHYRTKGDANTTPDPWTFTLDNPKQARVVFGVPFVGYIFAILSIPLVRLLVIGLPALLVAMAAAASLWQEAGSGAKP